MDDPVNLPIGFAPVVYEHAAAFVGLSPYQASRTIESLFRAHAAAYEFYWHRPIAVGIDVYNLEAEAFGAIVVDTGGGEVPSVDGPLVQTAAEISGLPDWDVATQSRFGLAFEAGALLKHRFPEADIRIPLGGPFSIAATLLGFDNLLCECLTDPQAVSRALAFLARKQVEVVKAAAAHGFGTVLFESAAAPPLLSPDLFRQLELPALRLYTQQISPPPALILGGDALQVLDQLISLNPGFLICPAETDQTAFMEALRSRPEIGVRLNMNVSALMAADIKVAEQEADRVVAVARQTAVTGRRLLVGTGVLPLNADPERIRRLGKRITGDF